jgi:DNA-directed RNA polymerase specialized sigma24 family protein
VSRGVGTLENLSPDPSCQTRLIASLAVAGRSDHKMSQHTESIADLAMRCRNESNQYLRHESTDGASCFELFRRAICGQDQDAWAAIMAQYRGIVLAWVRRHPAASDFEDESFWVNRTFDRFWSALGSDRFEMFGSLGQLLRYLKMCAHSVIIDELRSRQAARLTPLDDAANDSVIAPDEEGRTLDQLSGQQLWRAIIEALPDPDDQLVVYLSFALDLKASEIQRRYPGRFPTVADVYRRKRNLLDRLRRNPAVRQFQE